MSRMDWKILLLLVVILWLQMTIMPLFEFYGVAIDLILLYISFLAFIFEYRRVLLFAFVAGCFKDLLTEAFFGLETVSLVCGTLILKQIAVQFDRQDERVQGLGIFLFSFSVSLIHAVLLALVEEHYHLGSFVWFQSVLIALYAAVSSIFVFPVLKHLFRIQPTLKQYELFEAN